jgi:hypothetical protein
MQSRQTLQAVDSPVRAVPVHVMGAEHLLRPVAVIGLLGIALIHFLDIFGTFAETAYLGVAYLALIGACVVATGMLMGGSARRGWRLAVAASGATLAGYVLSRTIGLPAATGNIGNWTEPLGLASMFVEGAVVAMGAYALRGPRRPAH